MLVQLNSFEILTIFRIYNIVFYPRTKTINLEALGRKKRPTTNFKNFSYETGQLGIAYRWRQSFQ